MASYALIPIMSGFEFDLPNGHIGFGPYNVSGFKSIWSVAGAWGEVIVSDKNITVTVTEGELKLKTLGVKFLDKVSGVKIDGKDTKFEYRDGKLLFDETAVCRMIEIAV